MEKREDYENNFLKSLIWKYPNELLSYFNIDLEIDEKISNEILYTEVDTRIIENLYKLKNGGCLSIKFRKHPVYEELFTFATESYLIAENLEIGTDMLIIYTEHVKNNQLTVKCGINKFITLTASTKDFNGDEKLEGLQTRIEEEKIFRDYDKLELCLLPFMESEDKVMLLKNIKKFVESQKDNIEFEEEILKIIKLRIADERQKELKLSEANIKQKKENLKNFLTDAYEVLENEHVNHYKKDWEEWTKSRIAINLLKYSDNVKEIAKITELSENKIKELKEG